MGAQLQKIVKVAVIKSWSRSFSNNFVTFHKERKGTIIIKTKACMDGHRKPQKALKYKSNTNISWL